MCGGKGIPWQSYMPGGLPTDMLCCFCTVLKVKTAASCPPSESTSKGKRTLRCWVTREKAKLNMLAEKQAIKQKRTWGPHVLSQIQVAPGLILNKFLKLSPLVRWVIWKSLCKVSSKMQCSGVSWLDALFNWANNRYQMGYASTKKGEHTWVPLLWTPGQRGNIFSQAWCCTETKDRVL